jgi:hypothetical protein
MQVWAAAVPHWAGYSENDKTSEPQSAPRSSRKAFKNFFLCDLCGNRLLAKAFLSHGLHRFALIFFNKFVQIREIRG